MPVRDVLWACPACRTAGAIRPQGRRERCECCGADFRRGRGARIVVRERGATRDLTTGEWLRELGPPVPPPPRANGVILGPETVSVKFARGQAPLYWRSHLLGWVERYERSQKGSLTLLGDALVLTLDGEENRWGAGDITGLQPASSSIQLRLPDRMVSLKFLEGSVRLWTAALMQLLRRYHDACGREIVELQPFLRTRARPPGRLDSQAMPEAP